MVEKNEDTINTGNIEQFVNDKTAEHVYVDVIEVTMSGDVVNIRIKDDMSESPAPPLTNVSMLRENNIYVTYVMSGVLNKEGYIVLDGELDELPERFFK